MRHRPTHLPERFSFAVGKELKDAIRDIAAEAGVSEANLVRSILKEGLAKRQPMHRGEPLIDAAKRMLPTATFRNVGDGDGIVAVTTETTDCRGERVELYLYINSDRSWHLTDGGHSFDVNAHLEAVKGADVQMQGGELAIPEFDPDQFPAKMATLAECAAKITTFQPSSG